MPITSPASGVRAGTVAHFAANTAPGGWLECNGAAVSRTLYGALFTAIGTTYGVGDGSTTFKIPDLRGEFIRGMDNGRGVDTGRGIGSAQAQDVGNHGHPYRALVSSTAGGNSNGIAEYFTSTTTVNRAAFSGAPGPTVGQIIGGNGGTETRPRNVAMLACIKF